MGSFAHKMKTPLTSIIGYANTDADGKLRKKSKKKHVGIFIQKENDYRIYH